MRRGSLKQQFSIYLSLFLWSATLSAGQPLLNIVAVYKAPQTLAQNSFTASVYRVTNNTTSVSAFVMKQIPGVTQVTSIPGSCQKQITLNGGQSCLLYLNIIGSQVAGSIKGGPVICNNAPNPFACAQAGVQDMLNLTIGAVQVQNNWISVLVAQDEPTADLATYLNDVIKLAPNLKQLHLRITAGATDYSLYANAINLFHAAYGSGLSMGYHPDNSSGSYSFWGCAQSDGACILNKSIQTMNSINALVDPQQTGQGFTIFSLEQSYVEIDPATPQNFADVKNCLNPSVGTAGTCPVCASCTPQQTYASPVVKFGNVSQSYGVGIYGPTMLDFDCPQFYNLGKKIATYQDLFTNGYFPTYSTQCTSYSADLYVVDIDSNGSYSPEIPCLVSDQTASNVYTYPEPRTGKPDPTLVAANLAFLMTQYPPIAVTIPLYGAVVFIGFSGEPELFGSPGWTPDLLSQFNRQLNADFVTLNTIYPALFPSGGTAPSTLEYCIWNFSSMLGQ